MRLLDGLERQARADAVIDAVSRGVRALPLGGVGGMCCTGGGWGIRCIR